MTTIKKTDLPAIGAELAGGFYTGIIQTEGQLFALITAPKELELTGEWGTYGTKIPGANSPNNGQANTIAMAEAGSALAQKVLLIDHAGFKDFFIPSRDELEMMYRAFKPTNRENHCTWRDGENASSLPNGDLYEAITPAQTEVEAFIEGNPQAFEYAWHWSSTQYRAYDAGIQYFSGGGQISFSKDTTARVRPVRRLLIS
jgi:hypothetical protein